MYSGGQTSTRSASGSRTDSYDHPSNIKLNGRPYQARSSITEDAVRDDNEYAEASDMNDQDEEQTPSPSIPPPKKEDQYMMALSHRFHNRPKSDYSYKAPPGPKIPNAPPLPTQSEKQNPSLTNQNGPYSSTVRPNINGGGSTPPTYEGRTASKPVLDRVVPNQGSYAKSIAAELEARERARAGLTTKPSISSPTTTTKANSSGLNVRINDPKNPIDHYNRQSSSSPAKTQLSIFEKVPSQGGPVSYLGTATFFHFEHCLRQCLERERQHTGVASQIIRDEIPATVSASSYCCDPIPTSSYSPRTDAVRVHTFDDYPSQPLSTYTLDDVRYINAALSRSGISLFPFRDPYTRSCSSPISTRHYRTGDVVSACQIAEDDPAMLFSKNGTLAVRNVWNAIRNYREPYNY